MMSDVGVFGVGEAVEVRPQQRQTLGGDSLDRLMNAVRIFARQRLSEPLQRLPLAKSSERSAGGLAHIGRWVAPRLLQREQRFLSAHRLPPAETADRRGAVQRIPVVGG